tara:strand:- start:101 stop:679 length:579 start_codon:yes stop_codon:yes gene_type:complete
MCFNNSIFSQKIELGVKIGPSLASQYVQSIKNIESITGYHFGFFTSIKLPFNFTIQPEIQYSRQGAKFSFNQVTAVANLDYINIPILLGKDFNFINFHIGTQFGFLSDVNLSINQIPFNIKENILKSDYSFVSGIKVKLFKGFSISFRYVKGLKNIVNPDLINSILPVDAKKIKNILFQLSINYSIVHKIKN